MVSEANENHGCIKRTAVLLSGGGRSLLGSRFRGLLDSSAVVEFGRKLLATRLDCTELVLEAGSSAGAVELGHQAIVLSTQDNTGSVHGSDHAGDLVEREGLGLAFFLGCHFVWWVFRVRCVVGWGRL